MYAHMSHTLQPSSLQLHSRKTQGMYVQLVKTAGSVHSIHATVQGYAIQLDQLIVSKYPHTGLQKITLSRQIKLIEVEICSS